VLLGRGGQSRRGDEQQREPNEAKAWQVHSRESWIGR
jgi:hypothetical protein